MISLLNSIVTTITSLVSFLINTITSLLYFLTRIPQFIAILTSSIGFMPSVLIPFAIVTISISVILVLVGRNV